MRARTLRMVAVAAVLLVAATALCLLDGDDAGGSDLCGIPLVLTTGLLALAGPLAVAGRSVPALAGARSIFLPDLPAPHPKA